MRMLFVTLGDASDVASWSGTNFYMRRALERAGAELVTVSPLTSRLEVPFRAAAKVATAVTRHRFLAEREPWLLRDCARQIESKAARAGVDLVFSSSSLPVTFLDGALPTAFWTDATFAATAGYYPELSRVSRRSLSLGHRMEATALARSRVAFYSSPWAARSAIADYGKDPAAVEVVPFGANIEDPGPVTRSVPDSRECTLLIVGKDWHRKGVDLATATAARLRNAGIAATLEVVGAAPAAPDRLPPWVHLHGALDKSRPDDVQKLDALYRRAAFFILPSRADCTPVVLAEAQAYGLPVVASDTGGISSMVGPGSGEAFDLPGFPEAAAAFVSSVWSDPVAYSRMSRSARTAFTTRFNWDTAARTVLAVLEAALRGSG
jgi:glycosyltransferase involved in cell wall biosynthesis